MPKLRVSSFAVSIDGFGAGPNQDLQHPIGVGGLALMEWFFETRTWKHMHGLEGGETGIDDNLAAEGLPGIGAWILGRNMFGPVRGPWPDDSWKGWWGDEPPYHTPVFVLTHHPRPPLAMKGGTEIPVRHWWHRPAGARVRMREARRGNRAMHVFLRKRSS